MSVLEADESKGCGESSPSTASFYLRAILPDGSTRGLNRWFRYWGYQVCWCCKGLSRSL